MDPAFFQALQSDRQSKSPTPMISGHSRQPESQRLLLPCSPSEDAKSHEHSLATSRLLRAVAGGELARIRFVAWSCQLSP